MTCLTKTKCISIQSETLFQSIVSDFFTAISLIAATGVGVLLESDAMQWAGFVLFGIWVIVRARGVKKVSPQEAADELFEKFGVRAVEDKP